MLLVRSLALTLCAVAWASLPDGREEDVASLAAIKAVQEIESRYPQESVARKAALAAAKAAGEALLASDASLNDRAVGLAEEKAAETMKSLRKTGMDTVSAAESAAVVVAGAVDETRGRAESQRVVQSAEAAAVAAAHAVEQQPNNMDLATAAARAALSRVVTAEAVARDAARAGVAEAKRTGGSSQTLASVAATSAAVAALDSIGQGGSDSKKAYAKTLAEPVYVISSEGRRPVEAAAKNAADVVVDTLNKDAPALAKETAEIAAEAAAEALAEEPQDAGLLSRLEAKAFGAREVPLSQLQDRAGRAAESAVRQEKLAQRAAIEAVATVEDEQRLPSSTAGQAQAAAVAAVDSVKAGGTVAAELAEEALSKGEAVYEKLVNSKGGTVEGAAEQAAEATLSVIQPAAGGDAEPTAVAKAAAVAAAEAVGESSGNAATAFQKAESQASVQLSTEELKRVAKQGRLLAGIFIAAVVFLIARAVVSSGQPTSKYQQSISIVDEEEMGYVDPGSILLTNTGFMQLH